MKKSPGFTPPFLWRHVRCHSSCEEKAGFSLIEVVIAMAIMIIGVVGVLELFPVGLRASRQGEMMTKVAFFGQEKLEEIKLAGYDAIAVSPPEIPLEGSDGNYNWAVTIEEVELDGLPLPNDVRKVVVTVGWRERGQERQREFATYITNH